MIRRGKEALENVWALKKQIAFWIKTCGRLTDIFLILFYFHSTLSGLKTKTQTKFVVYVSFNELKFCARASDFQVFTFGYCQRQRFEYLEQIQSQLNTVFCRRKK